VSFKEVATSALKKFEIEKAQELKIWQQKNRRNSTIGAIGIGGKGD